MTMSNLNTNKLLPQYVSSGLPGLSNWATITAMTGSPTRYSYSSGGTNWYAFQWNANGSVTLTSGVIDFLMAGAGADGWSDGVSNSGGGGGGGVFTSIRSVSSGTYSFVIGTRVAGGTGGTTTAFGLRCSGGYVAGSGGGSSGNLTLVNTTSGYSGGGPPISGGGGAGGAASGTTGGPGVVSSITGTSLEYGRGSNNGVQPSPAAPGQGGAGAGLNGAVIIRVPAEFVTASSGWV